jgi:hypothetical protein
VSFDAGETVKNVVGNELDAVDGGRAGWMGVLEVIRKLKVMKIIFF